MLRTTRGGPLRASRRAVKAALATLDALPGEARVITCPACGESCAHPDDHAKPYPAAPLKPGDEVTICHETGDDGYAADILVTVRADEVYLRPRVSACNGTTFGPEMLVDPEAGISLTHAQAAELCATLARVRGSAPTCIHGRAWGALCPHCAGSLTGGNEP